jgi:twinkle protein
MNKFIEWETLNFKKQSGKEKVSCPICDAEKQRKGDKPIAINHSEGFGKCFRCESLTFRKDDDDLQKTYNLPIQTITPNFEPKFLSYINSRKISESTLNALYVTQEMYFQPSLNANVQNIVFNYFEGDVLVNKKFRSANKKFTQTSGTKTIFYNINSIIGQDTCYIVEGEFDVLAMYEAGYKNVISVPNGANDNDDYWQNSEKYLKDIKKFIIATDNDTKGNDLKDKIAQRLGRYRCEFIEWKNKDANGDLIAGVINESVKNKKNFPVGGTFTVSDLYDDILSLYDNGLPETIYPKHRSFGGLKDIFTVMRGHLITGTGVPSHGKSNFTEWYVLNLVKDYNMKASFFSPEHSPMPLHKTTFIQKTFGKNFWKDYKGTPRISKEEIKKYKDWANEKIYLTGAENGEFPSWDWILNKFKEQMYSFGIDIFVIDAFNKLELPSGNTRDEINKVLTKLTMFAQMNNVIIFLVAHPTKMKKDENTGLYQCPTLYDVSGSADFRNQTHDGFSIYRYFENEVTNQENTTTFINLKTKMSFQGEINKSVDFNYHMPSGRYYAKGCEVPTHDMTLNEDEIIEPKEIKLPLINTKDAFEIEDVDKWLNDDEIPF